MTRARYSVLHDVPGQSLVICDEGGELDMTITNDVEAVVAELVADRFLPEGRRLLYYDSYGALDEILVHGGCFVGLKAGTL